MEHGRIGELKYAPEDVLPLSPSEYFHRNVYVGASFPSPVDAEARHTIGVDHYLWGSDYPHHEASWPYTRELLRRSFADTEPDELQRLLAGNAAEVYGFDLSVLDELAAPGRPHPRGDRRAPRRHPRRRHQPRLPPPMSRFDGRRALVTGASRGIGAALAVELARQGADVAICARTADTHPTLPGSLSETAAAMEPFGGRVAPITVDLTDADDRATVVAERRAGPGRAARHPGQQRRRRDLPAAG